MTTLKQKPNGVYYLDTEVPVIGGGLRRARVGLDTRDREAPNASGATDRRGPPQVPRDGRRGRPEGRAAASNISTSMKADTPNTSNWPVQCLGDPAVWGKRRADITHRSNVKVLSGFLPHDLQIGQLSGKHLEDLAAALRGAGYAEGSVRKLVGNVRTAANRAVDVGHLLAVPKMPKIDRSDARSRVLSLDEEAALLECIEARRASEGGKNWWWFGQLVLLLLDTGMRVGEALQAGPSWVKRKKLLLHSGEVGEGTWLGIPQWASDGTGGRKLVTKSGRGRDIPLTARAIAIAGQMTERMEGTRWFPWKQRSGSPITMLATIRGDMALRGYDISDVVLRTMRHTCATRLAENGFDLVGLRDFLGHSDIKITAGTYLHLMNGHVFLAAAILDSMHSSGRDNDAVESSKSTMPDIQPSRDDRAFVGTMGVH